MCPGSRYFNYPLSMTHPTVQLNWFKIVNWSTWGTMFQLSQNSGRLKWKISWNNSNDIVLSINVEQNKIRQYLSMISTYLLSPCCEWPLNERIISKNDILPPRHLDILYGSGIFLLVFNVSWHFVTVHWQPFEDHVQSCKIWSFCVLVHDTLVHYQISDLYRYIWSNWMNIWYAD